MDFLLLRNQRRKNSKIKLFKQDWAQLTRSTVGGFGKYFSPESGFRAKF